MNIWTPQNNIVTDGLVLHLDAGIKASYPGSGTTWGDLSSSNFDGTLVGGVGFSNTRGGTIVFDGVNDYVNSAVTTNTSSFTIDIWLKADRTTHQAVNYPFSFNGVALALLVGGTYEDPAITARSISLISGNTTMGSASISIFTEADNNLWRNIVVTYNPATGATIHKNNIAQAMSTNITGFTKSSGTNLNIGRRSDNIFYWDGDIAIVRYYERVLSPIEITQNFESQRKRFGI